MLSRRSFLSTLIGAGGMAVPLGLGGTRGMARALRLAPGLRPSLPNPAIGWRGESAFAMGVRQAAAAIPVGELKRRIEEPPWPPPPPGAPRTPDIAAIGARLRARFPDLRRHLVFEYYPWYGVDPWRHWDQWERRPPVDIAATSMPRLGPYDSRSRAVLEQHARWIAESGVGAINLSWWGPGSYEDRAAHLVMDVMRDHDIRVTFHLEPYRTDRVAVYADDVAYLLREYGDKRRWDVLLVVEHADGTSGPVFKSFRTIVPREVTDCHGRTLPVPDWVEDSTWRRQTDSVREATRRDFDRVTLLADVHDVARMAAAGFDGMAVYDNFVRPSAWTELAQACSVRDLVFSFNVNPGFDGIEPRTIEPGSCYAPLPIEPKGAYDWTREGDRETAALSSQARIAESLRQTLALQASDSLANHRRGFFLVFVNSFNEWHEGHQFEPMRDAAQITAEERRLGYRNPTAGEYRLRYLDALLRIVLQ